MNINRAVPLTGKSVYYKSDGTGRDSYIKNINGGLLSHDRIHQLKTLQLTTKPQRNFVFGKTGIWKKPSTYKQGQTRFSHYASDGTGRDAYIKLYQGGNSRPFHWKDHVDYKFRNSLRSYQKLNQPRNPEDDIFSKTQSKMSKSQMRQSRIKSVYQISLSQRLAHPKSVPKPPSLYSYFEKTPIIYHRIRNLSTK